jgi:hypothetical protein
MRLMKIQALGGPSIKLSGNSKEVGGNSKAPANVLVLLYFRYTLYENLSDTNIKDTHSFSNISICLNIVTHDAIF